VEKRGLRLLLGFKAASLRATTFVKKKQKKQNGRTYVTTCTFLHGNGESCFVQSVVRFTAILLFAFPACARVWKRCETNENLLSPQLYK